ncbi:hypothetical protein [Ochrobactrum chromiisoli]|uniref:DUF485 domain-containing protein n=1 Tax=Ochrobactrum chromiisoli TaxID=2993941 RepID=A0ABT3QKT9_9HYPH|nr:hypothetical protein [Ochrobactrum chromiisoli]MCX2696232.1 hypothetical protein [Ochrobactrum chromiisoli]
MENKPNKYVVRVSAVIYCLAYVLYVLGVVITVLVNIENHYRFDPSPLFGFGVVGLIVNLIGMAVYFVSTGKFSLTVKDIMKI